MRSPRRSFLESLAIAGVCGPIALLSAIVGCVENVAKDRQPDLVWSRRGTSPGRLLKPRAMVVDRDGHIVVVDKLGRLQVFQGDGTFIRGWRTPEIKHGLPTGLGLAKDGSILVADTHYHRILFYSIDGELQSRRTIGGVFGDAPGEFHFVTDVCQDDRGHIYTGQYGQVDQIQEFSPDGEFIRRWGKQGSDLGDFARPQGLLVDRDGLLWVADAHNHRVQVFRVDGPRPELVKMWGKQGRAVGKLQYPYGLEIDLDGTVLLAEYGGHRVQRFTADGAPLEVWGSPGSQAGQFDSPWALALDSQHFLHVLDTLNHRVQRFPMG